MSEEKPKCVFHNDVECDVRQEYRRTTHFEKKIESWLKDPKYSMPGDAEVFKSMMGSFREIFANEFLILPQFCQWCNKKFGPSQTRSAPLIIQPLLIKICDDIGIKNIEEPHGGM